MKKIIMLLALLVLLASCVVPDKQPPQVQFLGANPVTVNTRFVTLTFTAVDNKDTILNYVVFIDSVQVSTGQINSNASVSIPIDLPDKSSSVVKVVVTDQSLNVGMDQITVYVKDTQAPVVTIISITPR